MDEYIPYNKLSKKKKKEADSIRRNNWGYINPVTRKSKNPKAYDRHTEKKIERDANIECT